MPVNVIMPALGMAQETGTLLAWLCEEGASVAKGEPLMEVATDKTDMEVESPASGTLARVRARPGDEVPVGETIAVILADGETLPSAESEASEKATASSTSKATSPASAATPVAARMAAEHGVDLSELAAGEGGRIYKKDVQNYLASQSGKRRDRLSTGDALDDVSRLSPASPLARRWSVESGLDLAAIPGSGPDGAVLAADVVAFQSVARVAGAADQTTQAETRPISVPAMDADTVPVGRMWQVMAQRLGESWRTVPHFFLSREVDATQLVAWRERAAARSRVKITFTDLLTKAVAAALVTNPQMNVSWMDGELRQHGSVHVGLAVAVDNGLLVPVVHHAQTLRLGEIAERRAELVHKAQAGKLLPADLQNGTFTISNLGMYGIDSFNAIVNPPQAGILAVGRIVDRVVPLDGSPAVRPMVSLTLSCDHRAVDGAGGARFLQTLTRYLEDPLSILE